MAKLVSSRTKLVVQAAPVFTPPYPLPAAGRSLGIGVNTAYDIRPPEYGPTIWSYAVFQAWNGGAFVPDYSLGGAWVIAGTGGHQAPANIGAAIFDFNDATWKRLEPQGGQYRYDDFDETETNGDPFFEINGSGGVPSPCHSYNSLSYLAPARGGGPKGGVLFVTRAAVCKQSVSSRAAHQLDLSTGLWSRYTSSLSTRVTHSASVVWDEPRARWWHLTSNQNTYGDHGYLDAQDKQFKLTATYPYFNNQESGGTFLHGGLLIRQGVNGALCGWNPDAPTLGWKNLSVIGTLPANANVFTFFPPTGNFYVVQEGGGQLSRLVPPADLWNGSWETDTVSVTSALPSRTIDAANPPNPHYNSLFYVPSIQRLAWVPGGGDKVYLVYPAS